jgi:hypothetical protein
MIGEQREEIKERKKDLKLYNKLKKLIKNKQKNLVKRM